MTDAVVRPDHHILLCQGLIGHVRPIRPVKAGERNDLATSREAARSAVRCHPHWQAEFARLAPHLGDAKAIVTIARKLLVAVWHVLSEQAADRFAEPVRVAQAFLNVAYRIGRQRLPDGLRPLAFTRQQLDRLQIGRDLTRVPWGRKAYQLPPSKLTA